MTPGIRRLVPGVTPIRPGIHVLVGRDYLRFFPRDRPAGLKLSLSRAMIRDPRDRYATVTVGMIVFHGGVPRVIPLRRLQKSLDV